MSPSIIQSNQPTTADADFDLQTWLKEIEGAENLMSQVETKADNLQAKVDALLLEVAQPIVREDVAMAEAPKETHQDKEQ